MELEDVKQVNVSFIYLNSKNEIDQVFKKEYKLKNINFTLKTEIIEWIQDFIFLSEMDLNTYTVIYILQHNVDILENNLDEFIHTEYTVAPFFNVIGKLQDIYWKPTIFSELNELVIIFAANKKIQRSNKTKKRHG